MWLSGPDDDRLIRRSVAVEAGVTDSQLRRGVSRGELHRAHRGSYLPKAEFDALDKLAQHEVSIRAAVHAQGTPAVVSHQSAAVILGLPLWEVALDQVHLTRDRPGVGRRTAHLHVHAAAPESVPVHRVGNLAVTSVSRTIFDLAVSVGFEQAVVIADAALHRGLTTKEDLAAELEHGRGRRGHEQAVKVIGFADQRSESVGESRSRVGMFRAQLTIPDLQVLFHRPDGSELARTDFAWAAARLVGEFDGLSKYGRLLRPGQTPADVYIAERIRQDALHDLGYEMVRWIWSELARPDRLYPRIQAAIDRAARLHR